MFRQNGCRSISTESALWHKNANAAHAFDTWFLNIMPERAPFTGEGSEQIRQPFVANPGGYQTLNFLPSLATMLFGLMVGELLRSKCNGLDKSKIILVAGVGGIFVGWLLEITGICPIVKRIWTPSWALFSTGWCCLILGALYWVIDVKKIQKWTFPFIVVGMNSIAIYCMGMLVRPLGGEPIGDSFRRSSLSLGWIQVRSLFPSYLHRTVSVGVLLVDVPPEILCEDIGGIGRVVTGPVARIWTM